MYRWCPKPSTRRGEQLNAVEIEEAISKLADQPFEPQSFPYAFLEAFGNKSQPENKLDKSFVLGYVLVDDWIHSRGKGD